LRVGAGRERKGAELAGHELVAGRRLAKARSRSASSIRSFSATGREASSRLELTG
jgi:hypothetical protein